MTDPILIRMNSDMDKAVDANDFKSALKMQGHTNAAIMHSLEEIADGIGKLNSQHSTTNSTLERMVSDTHLRLIEVEEQNKKFATFMAEHQTLRLQLETRIKTSTWWLRIIGSGLGLAWAAALYFIVPKLEDLGQLPKKVEKIIERIEKLESKK